MSIIASIVGALSAIVYVGYFAYAVNELPLTVIVSLCLAMMLVALYRDLRKDQAATGARRESGKSG